MNSAAPCSVCKEGGHKTTKCPTLVAPLAPGFQGGGGGGGGHSHDDEEERLRRLISEQQTRPPTIHP